MREPQPRGPEGASTPSGSGPIRRRRGGRWALALLVGANVGASLFPFRFDPPRYRRNEVRRGAAGQVDFGGHNVLRSRAAPGWLDRVISTGRLSIELEAKAPAAPQSGPARLLAISESPFLADLVVGQGGHDLLLRVDRPGSNPSGGPAFVVPRVFERSEWVAIAVALEPDRVRVEVDGEVRLDEPLPEGYARRWSSKARLALGDEPGGGRPWRGSLRRASIRVDGLAHDLLDPSALEGPAGSWVLPDRLRRASPADAGELAIALLHFAGFAPLGFLLARSSLGRHPARRAVVLCALLGVGLAVGKIFVAGRHPAALDVAIQIAGGLCGALWAGRQRRA